MVLSRTLLRYSPGSHLSGTLPDHSSILAQILPFRYSPGSHISGTRPDFYISGTRPDSTISGTRPNFYFSGTCSDSTLSRYLPKPFSGTHPDSTFLTLAMILPFPVLTRIQPFPVLTRTHLRSLPRFRHLLRHHPWISLSFPALCLEHLSSQASYLVFFQSFNRSDSIPSTFSTR